MTPQAGIFQFALIRLTVILLNSPLQAVVVNDAWAKLLIITGCLKWYDLPHLHHQLIFQRILFEDMLDRKKGDAQDVH